jgi:zinc/manganese transport system substrate-binding protein
MKNLKYTVRTTSLLIAGAIILLAFSATAKSSNKIKVVATFSILGDMVKRIGGDHVHLTTLVGPNGDTHVYQPTPTAAKAMSEANVLIVNGLGFEGWLDRLVEASDFDGKRVIATLGIKAIAHEEGDDHDKQHAEDKHAEDKHAEDKHAEDKHAEDKHEDGHAGHDHGTFDPHAWQSVANAAIYVNNITASLSQVAPDKASTFYQNRAAYMAEINGLHNQILEMVARLPQNRRTVVTSHDAFQYFGRDYGLTFLAPQGLSTESEASAQDVAALIEQMRTKHIKAVFIENITDPRLLKQIANETGAIVGGTLYPGALSEQNGPAPTYLKMMHHNATTLIRALGS